MSFYEGVASTKGVLLRRVYEGDVSLKEVEEEELLRRRRRNRNRNRRRNRRRRRHQHRHPSNPYCHCRLYSQVVAHACLHVDVERRKSITIINDDNRHSTTINDKQLQYERQSTNKQRHTNNDTQTTIISNAGSL